MKIIEFLKKNFSQEHVNDPAAKRSQWKDGKRNKDDKEMTTSNVGTKTDTSTPLKVTEFSITVEPLIVFVSSMPNVEPLIEEQDLEMEDEDQEPIDVHSFDEPELDM